MSFLPGAPCWVADPEDAFVEAKIASVDGAKVSVSMADGASREVDAAEVRETNPGPAVPDLTTMVVLNEATMLQNVRERFGRDRIYTRAGLMLVAVNPGRLFAELYTDSVKGRSKDSDLHDVKREPHLYDVAEQAYRQLLAEKKSQSIIISGESGAGKTESIKYSMNYLVWRAPSVESSSTGAAMAPAAAEAGGQLTTRIMQSNPLLEALGNAKTQRNHNSSRFGKYITLQFTQGAAIVGAQVRGAAKAAPTQQQHIAAQSSVLTPSFFSSCANAAPHLPLGEVARDQRRRREREILSRAVPARRRLSAHRRQGLRALSHADAVGHDDDPGQR